jgi:hypothetical protein
MRKMCCLAVLLIALALWGIILASGSAATTRAQADLAVIDDDPPIIETFRIEPTSVDTGGQSQAITVTMAVSDLGSGVNGAVCGINVTFVSPSGRPFPFLFCHGVPGEPDALIEDNERLGTWQNVQILPANSEAGEWKIDEVFLVDKSGNFDVLSYEEMLNYRDPPFPVSFRVANTHRVSIPIVLRQYQTDMP